MFKNYLILAHHSPRQLKRLVQRLNDVHSYFYIHIDLKSDINQFEFALSSENIHFIRQRVNAIWGNYSIVQATLNGLNQILTDNRKGFVILLSGQDYPLAGNKEIKEYLQINKSYNFIDIKTVEEAWPSEFLNKTKKYYINLTPKRGNGFFISYFRDISFISFLRTSFRLIKNCIIQKNFIFFLLLFKSFKQRISPVHSQFGGSQWWALNYETVVKIMDYLNRHSNYIEYYKFTYIPDEIFFHTVIKILQEKDKSILIKPSLMHVNWQRLDYNFPLVFGINDTNELIHAKQKEKFFARKFEETYDSGIMDFLDIYID
jgi:hypothetical protein